MDLIRISIAEIAELGTQVAMHGAVRAGEVKVDPLFELVVGVVALVVQVLPRG